MAHDEDAWAVALAAELYVGAAALQVPIADLAAIRQKIVDQTPSRQIARPDGDDERPADSLPDRDDITHE